MVNTLNADFAAVVLSFPSHAHRAVASFHLVPSYPIIGTMSARLVYLDVDGVHAQCRFCGDFPFTGVPCPEGAAPPAAASCAFGVEPETPYYWDPACSMGMHGCNADGKNVHCRFCGGGGFEDIHCPGSHVCEFEVLPSVPYFWDESCEMGLLGCKADGVHPECRFCGQRPFESVPCPEPTAPPQNQCHWPQRGEPSVPYFWDESCDMGLLGCWADGIHGPCRFCGTGVFSEIACP